MKNQEHHEDFDIAHFNPKELEILDETQGGRTNFPKSKIRHFERLEHLMSDPKMEKLLMKQYEHHAKGGRIGEMLRDADSMRQKGRRGDIDIAVIGPNTRRIFNKLMHGGSVNPGTGKSEYFNLGGMMKGIGHTVSRGVHGLGNMAGKAVSGATHMATQALPGAIMGGMEGGPAGALAGGMGSLAMNQMQGGGKKAPPLPQNLGQMGQQFMNSQMGQNMQNKAQGMYNNANQQYQGAVNSPMGKAALGAYNGYTGQNQNMASSLRGQANRMSGSLPAQQAQLIGNNSYNYANKQYQGAMNSPQGQSFQNGYNGYQNGMQQQGGNQGGSQGGYDQGGYGQGGYDQEDYA